MTGFFQHIRLRSLLLAFRKEFIVLYFLIYEAITTFDYQLIIASCENYMSTHFQIIDYLLTGKLDFFKITAFDLPT